MRLAPLRGLRRQQHNPGQPVDLIGFSKMLGRDGRLKNPYRRLATFSYSFVHSK
jgi:hypothetical protein